MEIYKSLLLFNIITENTFKQSENRRNFIFIYFLLTTHYQLIYYSPANTNLVIIKNNRLPRRNRFLRILKNNLQISRSKASGDFARLEILPVSYSSLMFSVKIWLLSGNPIYILDIDFFLIKIFFFIKFVRNCDCVLSHIFRDNKIWFVVRRLFCNYKTMPLSKSIIIGSVVITNYTTILVQNISSFFRKKSLQKIFHFHHTNETKSLTVFFFCRKQAKFFCQFPDLLFFQMSHWK